MGTIICRLTFQVFFALFVAFRGYSNLRFIFAPLRLCVRFSRVVRGFALADPRGA